MNYISNIHKSFSFTILLIVSALIGIILSLYYSNSGNNYLFLKTTENLTVRPKNIYSDYDFRRIDKNTVNLKYIKYPVNSVPVKVVLGKIKKIENPYLPNLHLAFIDLDKNIISLNNDLLLFD